MRNGSEATATGSPQPQPTEVQYAWRPQAGPQKALIDCPLPEIFFGGARGGGKTDGVLGKYALKAQRYGEGFNAVFFRRELPMLDDAIERSAELYSQLGARWYEQKKMWRFRQGGRLRFRPLERVVDAEKYQGQNLSDACVEEAGNYPDSSPIDRINGVLRSARGVPTQLILTGNPGGPGQGWIKVRYIDPAPLGMKVLRRKLPNGKEHRYVFIPSQVENNRILLSRDPEYINRLYLVGSKELVRAWLTGDWAAIEGAYFDCWRPEKHIIDPFTVPSWWLRFGSFDWGSAAPFSYGLWAVSDGSPVDGERQYPAGALIRIREIYGSSSPNVGLKLRNEEIAARIKILEANDKIAYRVADPACFKEDGGPSIAETMGREGVLMMRADNQRIPGWAQVRNRLIGDDFPMLYFFSTCRDTLRTLPSQQHDKNRPEDIDTEGEDHCADDVRYACMSRPYVRKAAVVREIDTRLPTLDEMWKLQNKLNGGEERI